MTVLSVTSSVKRSGATRVGTRKQEVRQPSDTLRVKPDVRAQEQDEAALAALEADVRGAAVAQVLRLDENGRLRELVGDGGR